MKCSRYHQVHLFGRYIIDNDLLVVLQSSGYHVVVAPGKNLHSYVVDENSADF